MFDNDTRGYAQRKYDRTHGYSSRDFDVSRDTDYQDGHSKRLGRIVLGGVLSLGSVIVVAVLLLLL